MEVEFSSPSSPSAGGSRHGSPFYASGFTSNATNLGSHTIHPVATAVSISTTAAVVSSNGPTAPASVGGPSRKRQRSIHYYYVDSASEGGSPDITASYMFPQETSDDEGLPAKRQNLLGSSRGKSPQESHFFRALGEGVPMVNTETEEYDFIAAQNSVTAGYDASDNGVDSPMHSLSLISPSGSLDDRIGTAGQKEHQNIEDDIDMTAQSGNDAVRPSGATHRSHETPTNASFMPRQVKSRVMHHTTNAPLRPSPLTQTQSDEASSSSDSSPHRRSTDTPRASHHPLRRSNTSDVTSSMIDNADLHSRRSASSMAERDVMPSFRRMSGMQRADRTPSPRPQPVTIHDDNEDEEDRDDACYTNNFNHTDGGVRRSGRINLNLSPGLGGQSSYFPGGRQMLRYTMGFRDDCELCQNKIPGHYGHVVHRQA